MVKRELRSRRVLEDVENCRLQVAQLRRECRHLEDRCTSVTQRYKTSTNGGSKDPHSALWDELADKKSLLRLREQALENREQSIIEWIEQLPNPRWRLLLRCRYLDGMDLTEVMETLEQATGRRFTMNQVYGIHRRALDAAEELWPLE